MRSRRVVEGFLCVLGFTKFCSVSFKFFSLDLNFSFLLLSGLIFHFEKIHCI